MRPRTDNSIEQGSGNTQIGHNTGEVHVGLTFEEHQQALKGALADKTADLERAHGAEKDLLRRETDELRRRLSEVETDYQDRLEELATLKAELSKFENRFEKEKFDAANAALDRDDTSLAEALFKELLKAAEARREDAEQDEAGLHYRLGKIAEDAVRWHDAHTHYKRAAGLSDDLDHLKAYARLCWRMAKGDEAVRVNKGLVERVKEAEGEESAAYAQQLNNLAVAVQAQGRIADAEGLYRETLEINHSTIGEAHPTYASHINNLASVVQAQGRYAEAEGLYREVLEIDRKTIGAAHPSYAIGLNNLALVVQAQGRVSEAETLYRGALEIGRKTIGEGHPAYAIRLNNLALAVEAQGRFDEAESLYREAMEIGRKTIGEAHPDHATRLGNIANVVRAQGRFAEAEGLYREALEITRDALGEAHPDYATRLGNLGRLLGETDRVAEGRAMLEQALEIFRAALPPDHPHIAETQRRLAALPDP